VITHFVGGSFGMKAMVWPHVTFAAMAARHVRRPVRLAMTRPQMFTSNGHREEQEQRITIGAKRDGSLTATPSVASSSVLCITRTSTRPVSCASRRTDVSTWRGRRKIERGPFESADGQWRIANPWKPTTELRHRWLVAGRRAGGKGWRMHDGEDATLEDARAYVEARSPA
jgi:hypothetical protein